MGRSLSTRDLQAILQTLSKVWNLLSSAENQAAEGMTLVGYEYKPHCSCGWAYLLLSEVSALLL